MDFKQKLKALYKKNDKIAPLIEGLEGEIPQQTLDDYYVKLKTIIKEDDDKKQGNYETISGQKKEVEIENIFDEPSIRRLLIIGGAGVGKSTLMQYMAYRWSTTDLWNNKFDYVYRVTLKTLLNAGWDRDYDKNERQEDELKCLIHYNLIAQGEGKTLKLQDMPWLEKKNKILLLLDGYDEVAHERNGLYKGLFENIFKHENIILTSRPNAIDKQMAEKFGKKIENTGLDNEGIEKYLTQYFKENQEKGETLKEFLDKNSSIKEICHIPVNIAMMCFIWSEGDSNQALHEISNMSDLYKQVVDHLGFRYYAKSNIQQNQDELMSKWKGGEIYLDELQVLEHTAYKGMTGGGLQVSEDKRSETLIIKGMTKKGDKDGISIQSSINYLRDQLKKDMPAINKVYKYGLLKPEGAIIDLKKNPKKELSETDLQEQSFSFIHLSFQEFLTALYLVQHLLKENNKEEQERIANFIAQHRNEPRYLVTLKLMTGILSAYDEDHKEAEQGIKIFWDAIMCNPDGFLELGVEAKVTLFMHLLGQAKKEDSLDKRIPNLQMAVDLIDSVILQDLTRWTTQLKESDYISPNLKEGLIQFLVKDNQNWISQTSSQLQEKFIKQPKKSHNVTIETVVEIIISFINKFSQDQQDQIFTKLTQFIKNHNNATWNLTKKAFQAIITLCQKSKITLDDNTKRELLETFLSTAYDFNLTQLSVKAIQQVLNIETDSSLMDIVKADLRVRKRDIKIEEIVKIKAFMLNLATSANDSQLYQDVIQNSFVPYLETPTAATVPQKILIVNTVTEVIAKNSLDSQFILEITKLLFPFLRDPQMNGLISQQIKILIQKIDNQQLIQDRINLVIPELQDPRDATVRSAFRELGHLIKIKGGSIDIQLVSDILERVIRMPKFSGPEQEAEWLRSDIKEFVKITCENNPQTSRAIFKNIIPFLQDQRSTAGYLAYFTANAIIDLIDENDTQLIKDILNIIIPVLPSPSQDPIQRISGMIANLAGKSKHLHQEMIEIFIQQFKNSNANTHKIILDILARIMSNNSSLGRDIINSMTLLFKHSEIGGKMLILLQIGRTLKGLFRKEPQFQTEVLMKSLVPLLQDSPDQVKSAIINIITETIPTIENPDIHFLQDLTKAFLLFLESSEPYFKNHF